MVWVAISYPTPWHLSHPGIKLTSLVSPAQAGGFFIIALLGKPHKCDWVSSKLLCKTKVVIGKGVAAAYIN